MQSLPANARPRATSPRWRILVPALLAITLGLLVYKGWQIAQRARLVHADALALAALADEQPGPATLTSAGPLLTQAQEHVTALRAEVAPLLPLAPWLRWVPTYGPLIASAEPLLDLGSALTTAAAESYAALGPLTSSDPGELPPGTRLVVTLRQEQHRLELARAELDRAAEIAQSLPIDSFPLALSAPLRQVRALVPDARDGLDLALAVPELLGGAGRREYLIYAQNPDELRPTGGFISAAGLLVVEDGQIVGLHLQDSGLIDNVGEHVYPEPPAPLRHYLAFELWLLRDSNWSPDFPTAARKGIELFALSHGREVDGVIAINPEALKILLTVTGPIRVDGVEVTAGTVIDYIRNGGLANQAERPQDWVERRKEFLPGLGAALTARLSTMSDIDPTRLAAALKQTLDERQVQVFLRQPAAAALLARRGWDGSLRTGAQDFLMVVDANLGYNKVNPKISQSLSYAVDLSKPTAPEANLIIRYTHQLRQPAVCDQSEGFRMVYEMTSYADWMAGCYWNYSRVLSPRATELISATAHPTPREWMLTGYGASGKAHAAPAEAGSSATGAFFVVPMGGEVERRLHFRLPPEVLVQTGQGWRYRLVIQKQSGSNNLPVTVHVQLPPATSLRSASPAPDRQSGQTLSFTLQLNTDQTIDLSFE